MTGDVVRRSSAYILTPTDTAICDSFLDEKWYRLDSLAGNDIVQTCPPVTHCGTLYPLWMNGKSGGGGVHKNSDYVMQDTPIN